MRKKLSLFIFGLLFCLTSCQEGVTSTIGASSVASEDLSTSGNAAEVAEEDQVRPASTNLKYTDYGLMGEHPDFDQSKWYRNDLKSVPLPDPYVLEVDGTYYIYGTTDRTGSKTLDCYETTDFNTFRLHMNIDYQDPNSWGKKTMFAPEVMRFDDTFYLYYSDISKVNNRRYIHVMTSDSPTGPFQEYQGENYYGEYIDGLAAPFFTHNDSLGLDVLDQTVFVDDDGQMYMYYSVYDTGIMQYIVGFEMLDPVTPDFETYKILVRPGEKTPATTSLNSLIWESYTSFKVAEGPFMLKSPVNGKYYLTYSVNHYPNRYYTVCYAVSDEPLGDYTKPYSTEQKNNKETWTNLLFGYAGGMAGTTVFDQWEGFMSGTAHHCFFKVGDQYMIGYHAHTNRKDDTSGRMFAMDYLFFDDEGVPYCHGPTYSLQPLPEGISGYRNIAPDAAVRSTNVEHPERINDNYITEHYNLIQEQDREVTLKAGKSFIELDFDREYTIGGINIYNSAFYDQMLGDIDFINFFNGNVLYNEGGFLIDYVNEEKEFIFPGSAFTFDFDDIKATRVVIGFNTTSDVQLNEIKILGY